MFMQFKRGQGSIILRVKILDSSLTTGGGLAGLTSASAGLRISTIADNESSPVSYTVAGGTVESIATLGTYAAPTAGKCRFKEVDATGHPGVYEIQLADARMGVAAAKSLLVSISGAANLAETDALIPLLDVDPYDAAGFGMSRLDAAVSTRMATGESVSVNDIDNVALNQIRNKFLLVAVSLSAPTVGARTVVLPDSNAANDGALVGATLVHLNASFELIQMRTITAYDHSTTMITVDADWTVTPLDTDIIRVYEPGHAPPSGIWNHVLSGTRTILQAMRGMAAVLLGKSSGSVSGQASSPVFRDLDDAKDVVSATTDASGNRSAVTKDLT